MKLDRVHWKDGRPYIEEIRKSGQQKGQIKKLYGEIKICQNCKIKCFIPNSNIKRKKNYFFCSNKCKYHLENNPNWKGGIQRRGDGYVFILKSNHPNADRHGYILKHRLMVEAQIGRYLTPKEEVHHINKIRNDNRLENLMVFKNHGFHGRFEQGLFVDSKNIIFDGRNLKAV